MTSTAWRTASSRRTGRSSFRSLGTLSTSLNIGTMIESFIGWLPPLSSAGSHAGEGIGQRSRTPHLVGRATDRAAPEISLAGEPATAAAHVPHQPRRDTHHQAVIGHIGSNDCPGGDKGKAADRHSRKEDRSGADRRSIAHEDRADRPVLLGLDTAVRVDRPRISIVRQARPRADKHAILEAGAPVQERPILDLDVVADDYVTIDIGTRTEDAAFPDHRSFAHTCQVPDARPLTDLCTG